jgi:hypothetical protein
MKPNKKVTKRIRSRKQSRSRSKRAGAQALIGSAWAPAANNSYRALTAPSATANHFRLSPSGGGFQPPVSEMRGPGMGDINPVVSPVRMSGGGFRRSTRAKKGGYIFGAFPEMAGTVLNNMFTGAQNIWKGIQGLPPLHSASPWIQPELVKPVNAPLITPIDVTKLQQIAARRVASV